MKKILVILLAFFLSGCSIAAVGPIVSPIVNGAIIWINGEANKYYDQNSVCVYRAARRSAIKMGLQIVDETQSDTTYNFTAQGHNKFKVEIKLIEPNITRLSVRVDFLGDKEYAELFYQHVDSELSIIDFSPDGKPKRRRFLKN